MKNQPRQNKQSQIKQRNKAAKKLSQLQRSAELLQKEIEIITEQLEHLDTVIQESSSNEDDQERESRLQVGDRVQYNKKPGKRLNKTSAHNPRGIITSISDHYISIRTDENADIINRAHFNVDKIES